MELPVSCLPAVAYLGFIFKDDYFLVFAFSLRGSHYPGPIDDWFTYRYLVAISDKQDMFQLHGAAFVHAQTLHVYGLSGGYFILLAARFNNRVNFWPPKPEYYISYGREVSNVSLASLIVYSLPLFFSRYTVLPV